MTRTVELGDTSLRYTAHPGSDGTPMLLLHPWFGCRAFWDPVTARTAVPAYAPDWYSLGEGDWSAWGSPHGLARATVALLDQEGVERVDVVGNSVGGIVAQVLAAHHPERVRRLVLVGTGASLSARPTAFGALVSAWISEPSSRSRLATELVSALVAHPMAAADRDVYVSAVLAADPDFISAVLGAARQLDLRPALAGISAPTLVIRGEHDTARTRDHVAELVTGIADCRAVEMTGCGHSPMLEDPDEFADLLSAHLSG